MDKTTLVGERDSEIAGRVLDALRRAHVPIAVLDWDYSSELDELQLVIATPLFDSRGPHEANSRVLEALQLAGIYQQTPIRRIFVKSPQDPTVKQLQQELSLRAEGAIHVVPHATTTNGEQYSVMFTPYTSAGGAVRAKIVRGNEGLRRFLEKRLEIEPHFVERTMSQLQLGRSASIPHVQLTLRQAKKLGLA